MVKRLVNERKISVRETEWQLVTNAYLGEQWQWASSGLHHEYLCQQMFSHATVTSQSEHNHAICWGRREPLMEQDLGTEPTTMELICPDSTEEDIADLYWDVYQFRRLLRRGHCKEGMEEHICQEILDSIKNACALCTARGRSEMEASWHS